MQTIVSTTWLKENLNDPSLVILDASPASNVSGKKSSCEGLKIPGAIAFDIKGKFSDKESPMPNTVPSAEQFQNNVRALGIHHDSKIVIYDNLGIYTAPRAWWLFKIMGHDDVAILDGGLPEWVKEGHATSSIEEANSESFEQGDFTADFKKEYVKYFEDIADNVEHQTFTIADARSRGRFDGVDPEPRAHLQSGSIPNSESLPFKEVLKDGKFKSEEELKELFQDKKLDSQDIVYSCGSGLTACIIMMAGQKAGIDSLKVYDGSWTEWAERNELKTN